MAADHSVSVVIPVRDGARFLEEAVASVAQQTRAAREVIVVDDGSADGSAEIAARLGALVERQPQRGPAAARNRGVELATGGLVSFLDADDVWPEDKLERQVATLDARPDVELLFGHVRQFGSDGALGPPQPGRLFGTLLVRRRALDRVGPFSTEWRVGELMEWLLRARDASVSELMTADVVLHRRLHASNLGRAREARVDHVRILREALDRRRGRVGG
jgi:glycosyltransferase involved in cell wall biosynthesis